MHQILHNRLDRLPSDSHLLLQLAAVVGRQVDKNLLHQMIPEINIEQWLYQCSSVAILIVQDNRWQFTHDKLRELILSELSDEKRPDLHRQVAEALEAVYPNNADYNVALLEHWHITGQLSKELQYLEPVVNQMIEITADYELAKTLIWRALNQLDAEDTRRINCVNFLANIAKIQGDIKQSQNLTQQALVLARTAQDENGIATSLYSLGLLAISKSDYVQAMDYHQQSLAIQQKFGNQEKIAMNFHQLGLIAMYQGNYEQAITYYQQSLEIRQQIADQHGIGGTLNALGIAATYQGNYVQAMDYHQQSLAIKQRIGDLRGIAASLNSLGIIAYFQSDYAKAQDYYQQSLTGYEKIGHQREIANTLNALGVIVNLQGDGKQAIMYLQQSLTIFRQVGDKWGIANNLTNLGWIAFKQQDSQASVWLTEALYLAKQINSQSLILEIITGFIGLIVQNQQYKRAGMFIGLVQGHQSYNMECKKNITELLPQIEDKLSLEDLETVIERGKSLDLDTLVQELLDEFKTG